MIGKKFNRLKVISSNKERSAITKRPYFNCICECGKEKVIRGDGLKNGSVKSCGCSRVKGILGKRFENLLVVSKANTNNNGQIYWNCVCTCGKGTVVRGSHLTSGNVKSCGRCFLMKDETGNSYGSLTVISFDKDNLYKGVYWICKCSCGNTKSVAKRNLQNGHIRSCGCLSMYFGKETCMERYGVEYRMQDPKFATQVAKAQTNSCILVHWKTNEEIVCVAGYEKRAVEYFNKNKIDFKWQHRTFKMPDGRTYRPDCYLIGKRKPWIEIKGYFRKNAKEKWEWFHREHPNSELWDEKKLKEMDIL